MTQKTIFSLVAMAVLFVGNTVFGATILIDLGRIDQETSLASWNDISGLANPGPLPTGPISLTDTTSGDSGIDIGFSSTSTVGFSGSGANYAGPYPAAVSSYPANAPLDGVYVTTGGTITATLSNLNPEATYNFLIYGADGNPASPGVATTWSITGLNFGADTISVTHMNSTEVALIEGIIPDGSNEISIVMSSPGIGRWNTLAITELLPVPVPEPSSCLLLMLGAFGLIRSTRRRRQLV